MRTVRRGLKDYLDLPAREFSKADLRAARDAINEGNSHMGNRLLGYTSPILKWAASEDLIDFNFAGAIRRAPEAKRERTLDARRTASRLARQLRTRRKPFRRETSARWSDS